MSSFLSKISPSSASIQKEYVEKRQRALYTRDPAKIEAVKKKVEAAMASNGVQDDWIDAYLKIHRALQASHLTINLEAGNWFFTDNKYGTYAQMYERGVGKDKVMVLKDADKKNPAVPRAMADDLVTVPEEWAHAHPFSQRKRLHKAMNVSGASLSAVVASKKGVTAANVDLAVNMKGDAESGYRTTNRDFKAKARQVFAGLNYGVRPHGSCTFYGFSYLVLNPALKANAIYYPSDTFLIATRGTVTQAAFNTIGALMEHASPTLMRQLWSSCYRKHVLGDTDAAADLIEAHIFKKLKISEDVQTLVLSRQCQSDKSPWSNAEWQHIVNNATRWCQRNAVRLTLAAP
ncbi:MAG TPA: hypothetical protein VGN07_10865 [Steroidobacteraceae bacterium]|jgi:hypothetical protein